jgi:hypothetical protein
MTIGDVRPEEINEDHLSSNEATPPIQANDQDKKMNKTRIKINIKMRAMIKGELCKMKRRMIKRSQDHHHLLTQEFDKPFNVITPLTTYLVT